MSLFYIKMKKAIIIFIVAAAFIVGCMGLLAHAAPITQGSGGGTGIGSASSTALGQCLTVASTSPFLAYQFANCGSGGSGSGTVFLLAAGNNLISLSPATITASGTISVNTSTLATFIGTLGYITTSTASSTYYPLTNPAGYTSSTGNVVGTGTSTDITYWNASNSITANDEFQFNVASNTILINPNSTFPSGVLNLGTNGKITTAGNLSVFGNSNGVEFGTTNGVFFVNAASFQDLANSIIGSTGGTDLLPLLSGTFALGTSTTVGDCAKWINTSTLADAGSPCGSGSGSSTAQLPTIIVSASGNGNFTNLAAAVAAANNTTTYPGGALIYLTDQINVVSSTATPLYLANNINITGNAQNASNTVIRWAAPTATSDLFAATGTATKAATNDSISNVWIQNTTTTPQPMGTGRAIDWSRMSGLVVNNVTTDGFQYGAFVNDTGPVGVSFFNHFLNYTSYDDNCIYVSSTQPVNDNLFTNVQCNINQSETSTIDNGIGLYLNNGQDNIFNDLTVEPPAGFATGTRGVWLTTNKADSNYFEGLWLEGVATGTQIDTGVQRTTFSGGLWTGNTTNLVDNGTDSTFICVNNNFTGCYNKFGASGLGVAGNLAVGTSTQSGLLNVVNSAGTTVLSVATSTSNPFALQVVGTSSFLGNVSTTIAANSFVATNALGILIATGTPSGGSGSSTPQVPTLIVSKLAGANFSSSSITTALTAAAVTSTYPNGAVIALPDSSYTVTSSMLFASGVVLQCNPGTVINFSATSTGSLNSPGSYEIGILGAGPVDYAGANNCIFQNTSSTYSGTALNLSNFGHSNFNNDKSIQFRYSIYGNDNTNGTFYNNITNWTGFDDSGYYASSTDPINDNEFVNDKFFPNQSATAGAKYGWFINNGQHNVIESGHSEPATKANTTGILLTSVNAEDNIFVGSYLESNASSVDIEGQAQRNQFFGGEWITPLTQAQNFTDKGFDTQVFGADNNFTGELNQQSISASSSFVNNSNADQGITFTNNTSFAQVGSTPLVKIQYQNGSDSANLLNLNNAGTGQSLLVTKGATNELSVNQTSTEIYTALNGYATSSLISVSSCGTTPNGSVVGSDNSSIITVGGTATGCTLNFSPKWNTTPTCSVDNQSMSITSAIGYTVTTSTVAITQAVGLSSDVLDVLCEGNPN